ncbi:helix-turn-helix domain-containing protein [Rhizobium laguerreae]|uniref:helix-turn-helix transcriptional regulator n=1 Tax=Rhizobium laguerreae TaxID=1076926 RepID=UPI00143FA590|nr:helix-turn-helix transcriptional regulator [Rhizobium laguerreae]NKM12085.1 helix-turn-helix domain-containing protein [Rhizobium laguerreae]
MRIPAPAEALRAARALNNLSQRAVAEQAGVSQKALSFIENTSNLLIETNLILVDFYVSRGIRFLGEASIGFEITGVGAKWAAPDGPVPGEALRPLRASDVPVPFKAARALLGKKQEEVAAAAGLTVPAVKGLEAGKTWVDSSRALVRYYESEGVEFTGWGDPSSGKFYGVGVRLHRRNDRDGASRS